MYLSRILKIKRNCASGFMVSWKIKKGRCGKRKKNGRDEFWKDAETRGKLVNSYLDSGCMVYLSGEKKLKENPENK